MPAAEVKRAKRKGGPEVLRPAQNYGIRARCRAGRAPNQVFVKSHDETLTNPFSFGNIGPEKINNHGMGEEDGRPVANYITGSDKGIVAGIKEKNSQ